MNDYAWARKLRIALIERDYGDTAKQVLDLCALVMEAESTLSYMKLKAFLSGTGTNPMVWRRLVSIAKDNRLPPLVENLPSSYTALYALSNFSDQELEAGVKQGVISAKSSSRQILDWIKQFRVGNGSGESLAKVLYLRMDADQTQEQCNSLIDALVAIAGEHGAQLVTDSEQLTKRYSVNIQRMEAGQVLREELLLELVDIYPLVSEISRRRLDIASVIELVDSDTVEFGQFLICAAGSRLAMFDQYSATYLKKIIYEYTRAKDRSQRFNYKRRLLQCKTIYPDASDFIDELIKKYIIT